MSEIKLYNSRWKSIKLLLMALPFVAAGIIIILTMQGEDRWIGWILIVLFAKSVLPFVIMQKPQIIMNQNVIWSKAAKRGAIYWGHILNVYELSIQKRKYISLDVDIPFVFIKKRNPWIAKMNNNVNINKINISLWLLKVNEKELTAFIMKMIHANDQERVKLIDEYAAKLK